MKILVDPLGPLLYQDALKGRSLITGNGGRIQLLEVDPMGGVNF